MGVSTKTKENNVHRVGGDEISREVERVEVSGRENNNILNIFFKVLLLVLN